MRLKTVLFPLFMQGVLQVFGTTPRHRHFRRPLSLKRRPYR